MGDSLGQQVVILNKPGAATAIAAQQVARAPADGYTLLLSPALMPKIGYDGIRDFAFVAMIASVPNVLVVRSALPVHDVKELIALAKQKPGTLSYGSVGNGSQPHLAAEMFQQMTGTKLNHIPYKGPRRRPPISSPGRSTSPSSMRRCFCRISGRENCGRWPRPR
jgi:tripartite-type tricarboxylate transporter receptor subunit TctC